MIPLAAQPTLRDLLILFLISKAMVLHAGRYEELQSSIRLP